jgi:hypothetical protein
MELTQDQVRAALAAGRIVRPCDRGAGGAADDAAPHLHGGRPRACVARGEGGFLETHGTLAPVLDDPGGFAPVRVETVQEAAAEDASATLEVAAENQGGRGGAQVVRRGRPRGGRRGP